MSKAPPKLKTQTLLVAGMHRSGTSALTKILSILGADLPKNLMPAMKGNNDAGFWESRDLEKIHDSLLESAGSSWSDWSQFNPDWFESTVAQRYKQHILDYLKQDFGNSPQFVIKDPRICRFLPLWLDVSHDYNSQPIVIIPFRNPLEVAESLKARDGMSVSKGLLLWLRHVIDAVHASRDTIRAFVSFDSLIKDWSACIETLSDQVGIKWSNKSLLAELQIEDFLDPNQKHQSLDKNILKKNKAVPDYIVNAYQSLQLLEKNANDVNAIATLEQIRVDFNNESSFYAKVLLHEQLQSNKLKIELNKSSQQLIKLEKAHTRTDKQINQLQEAHAEKDKRIGQLQEEHAEKLKRIDQLQEAHAKKDKQINQLQGEQVELNKQFHELQHVYNELNQINTNAHKELDDERKRALQFECQSNEQLQNNQNLQDKLILQVSEYERLNKLLRGTEKAFQNLQKKSAHQQEEITSIENKVDSVTQQLTEKELECEQLIFQQDALKQDRQNTKDFFTHYIEDKNAQLGQAKMLLRNALKSGKKSNQYNRYLNNKPDNFLRYTIKSWFNPKKGRNLFRDKDLILRSGLFDPFYYLTSNPDVLESGSCPLDHYCRYGWKENRNPNAEFDIKEYYNMNSDALEAGINPLVYFILYT